MGTDTFRGLIILSWRPLKYFEHVSSKIKPQTWTRPGLDVVPVLLFHGNDPGVDGLLFSLHQLDICEDFAHFICRELHLPLVHRGHLNQSQRWSHPGISAGIVLHDYTVTATTMT